MNGGAECRVRQNPEGKKEKKAKEMSFISKSNMSPALPAPSQQASRAALTAALTENTEAEPGEIQEVDMHAQAEGIRTVFSDPTNFNVKVLSFSSYHSYHSPPRDTSTPSTPHGRFGSTLLPQRVGICLRHPFPLFPRHPHLRLPVLLRHKVGWRTLNV